MPVDKEIDYSKMVDLCSVDYQLSDPPLKHPDQRIDGLLISAEMIEKRVRAIARQITSDYQSNGELLVVPVLKGAFVFASDLIREMHKAGAPGLAVDFIKTSTYRDEVKSTLTEKREVKIEFAPEDIKGRHLLVVEDIIDQCATMPVILDFLNKEKAKSVKTCVLIEKNLSGTAINSQKRFHCDYTGFRVPDRWIAGYGIDAGQDFRELPFIVVVNEAFYMRTGSRA
ncbi:MAG: hypoxanthine phosphoribosyltransferase [Desulfatiglans sp.]|jgi:hypoxanthine phosphoribosyltransferase|nr:hypoxanthine phosphoribosyltransferase [Desulfatiglans sp.]